MGVAWCYAVTGETEKWSFNDKYDIVSHRGESKRVEIKEVLYIKDKPTETVALCNSCITDPYRKISKLLLQ